jgi:hypothetical protein
MTQENFDNMQRVWVIKTIVEEAAKKCHELCHDRDVVPSQTVMDLMTIVLDSTTKATHIQWTDSAGLKYGMDMYLQSIKNL